MRKTSFRVSKDFHYEYKKHRPSITDHPRIFEDNTPPFYYFHDIDEFLCDFRTYSCDKHIESGGFQSWEEEFDPEVLHYDYRSWFHPENGFIVILHHPDIYPVKSGRIINQQIRGISYSTYNIEKFSIDDALKSWSVEDRSCYLPGEKNLTFFKIYNKANCMHECLSFKVLGDCRCVPFYMISKCNQVFISINKIPLQPRRKSTNANVHVQEKAVLRRQ